MTPAERKRKKVNFSFYFVHVCVPGRDGGEGAGDARRPGPQGRRPGLRKCKTQARIAKLRMKAFAFIQNIRNYLKFPRFCPDMDLNDLLEV